MKHSDIFIPAKFPIDSAKEQEAQNSLDLNFIEKSEINLSNAGRPFVTSLDRASKKSHSKRKYTLEELEVEGFEPSTSESEQQSNIPGWYTTNSVASVVCQILGFIKNT